MAALIHGALGTDPAQVGIDVMDDRVRMTVPVWNYAVRGISLLARRAGRLHEVSETAATGTIDFIDNPKRAERKGRTPLTGEEMLARIAEYLMKQPGITEDISPEKPASPPTFEERVATSAGVPASHARRSRWS